MPGKTYKVYIVECADKTYYTGLARDLDKRLAEHNGSALGAKYTRGRRPVKLVYSRTCRSRSKAGQLEAGIKKLNRQEKLELIRKNFKLKMAETS